MIVYPILSIFIFVGAAWLWFETRDTRAHNKKLFVRAWSLQLFLMDIYNDCPPNVQKKIDEYLNNIKPL